MLGGFFFFHARGIGSQSIAPLIKWPHEPGHPSTHEAATRKGAGIVVSRPSKYKEEFVSQAEKLCRLGATDIEIADFFGVDVRTLYRWKGEHEEFCQALKAGKDVSDERVERSLFARANGYEHDEVDIRVVAGGIVQTPIRKYYPPDTTAAIFWLKNRKPAEWRDKQDVELSGELKVSKITRRIVDPAAQ